MKVLFVINSPEAKFPKDLSDAMASRSGHVVEAFYVLEKAKKFGVAEKFIFLLRFRRRVKALRKVIDDFKPEIVHSHFWLSDILSASALKRLNGIKLISTQHDEANLPYYIASMKRRALKRFDSVIAISDSVARFLSGYFGVDKEKIVRIYNGIDIDYFAKAQRADGAWGPNFAVIARLEKIKGVDIFLRAMLRLKNPPLSYIVGDGSEIQFLEQLASVRRLEDKVRFTGMEKDIRSTLAHIDVVVIPSRSEGLGVVILEALASKKLVLASNIGGVKEIIKDRETGLTFEAGNVSALSEKIDWILNNQEEAKNLRSKAYNWFGGNKDKFDINNTVERYLEVYGK